MHDRIADQIAAEWAEIDAVISQLSPADLEREKAAALALLPDVVAHRKRLTDARSDRLLRGMIADQIRRREAQAELAWRCRGDYA